MTGMGCCGLLLWGCAPLPPLCCEEVPGMIRGDAVAHGRRVHLPATRISGIAVNGVPLTNGLSVQSARPSSDHRRGQGAHCDAPGRDKSRGRETSWKGRHRPPGARIDLAGFVATGCIASDISGLLRV